MNVKLKEYSVLLLYNTPRPAGAGACGESDAGVLAEVAAVRDALTRLGIRHREASIKSLHDLPELLFRASEPLVFNLVEGFWTQSEEANLVPAVCRAFRKGVTGNDTPALSMCLDKWRAKAVLRNAAIPCPGGTVVLPGEPVPHQLDLGPRVFVKPMATDASEGIDETCVISGADRAALVARVRDLHARFGQPVLVEPFIGSRELNVSVFQRGNRLEVLPLAEIDFSAFAADKPRIVGYTAKWVPESFEFRNTPRIIPAPVTEEQTAAVRHCAEAAWCALACRDYARVDFRLAEDGTPVVLEVNPNPDIAPDAGFAAALAAAGITYDQFVLAVLGNALERLHAMPHAPAAPADTKRRAAVTIRCTEAADRDPILALLADTGFFRPEEMAVATEVLDEAVAKGQHGHYQSFTAVLDGHPAGWVCYGPTPCTDGTFDIYWLGVSRTRQGSGIGRQLMEFAEQQIRERGGRLAVVETAGRAAYEATRAFYQRIGYVEASRLPEFYAPHDDKIVYLKKL